MTGVDSDGVAGASILVTNDDGIDAAGLDALVGALSGRHEVTVVAPTGNRSGVGQDRSERAAVESHPRGYALDGTPADCVAFGLRGLDDSFDLVVSGVNHGPNVGASMIRRSGTAGAAFEAALLGTPALAASLYSHDAMFPRPPAEYDFDDAASVARHVIEWSLAADPFAAADVINCNVPDDPSAPMRVTRPALDYDTTVTVADGVATFEDAYFPSLDRTDEPPADLAAGREVYETGTERRALLDGEISCSALTIPHSVGTEASLEGLVAAYDRDRELE